MLASAGRRVKRPVKVGKSPPPPLFQRGEIRFPALSFPKGGDSFPRLVFKGGSSDRGPLLQGRIESPGPLFQRGSSGPAVRIFAESGRFALTSLAMRTADLPLYRMGCNPEHRSRHSPLL
jgi:hypothetical protein